MFEIFRNIFFKEKKIDKNLETNIKYLEYIITQFVNSKKRMEMLTGERYYRGIHDILFRKKEKLLEKVENCRKWIIFQIIKELITSTKNW